MSLDATPQALHDHVEVDHPDDNQVVKDVHQNCSEQSIGEHQVEEGHADEPVVHDTELAGVLVTVTVSQVGGKHSSADGPGVGTNEKFAHGPKSGQVGDWTKHMRLKQMQDPVAEIEAAQKPVEDLDHNDAGKQISPSEQNFLSDSSGDRNFDTLSQNALGVTIVARLILGENAPGHSDQTTPEKNPFAGGNPVERATRHVPEFENIERHYVGPEEHDERDDNERLERENRMHNQILLRQSIHVVEVGDPR